MAHYQGYRPGGRMRIHKLHKQIVSFGQGWQGHIADCRLFDPCIRICQVGMQ
jgi:hypothetical protein